MRFMACVGLMAICLGPIGCSLFGKKSPNAGGRAPAPATPAAGGGANVAANNPVGPPAGVGGILAGEVIDSYNRRMQGTYIQVAAPKEGQPAGAPIEVAADQQGFFVIQGLAPGQHYQLTARVKDSERLLTGTVFATPPNSRLVIRVSEDFTTTGIPPLPAAPGDTRFIVPGAGVPGPAAEIGPPIRGGVGSNSAAPIAITPAHPENVAGGEPTPRSPIIGIQGGPTGPAPSPVPPLPRPPGFSQIPPAVQTAVPSCILTGNRVENFALNDLNGATWQFRQHRGRLVLLDFWGTWCTPCRDAIYHLKVLDERYRVVGLEIVGIAYEEGLIQEKARKVSNLRDRMQIRYQLLLGTGSSGEACPVKDAFRVASYPTLILLDETGQIILKLEGIDERNLQALESEIKRRLVR